MADNYLEKKFEEYRSGTTVIRKANPSLETLLRRMVDSATTNPSYVVKQAQLDAVVRAAQLLELPVEFSSDEAAAEIRYSGGSALECGQALLAMRLKAAELGLKAVPAGSGIIKVYK